MRKLSLIFFAVFCSASSAPGIYPDAEVSVFGAYDLRGECLYGDEAGDSDTKLCRSAANEWTLTAGNVAVLVCSASYCTFASGPKVGASIPFVDVAGVLTLQNVDALDATTEATLEAAIDQIDGHVTLAGGATLGGPLDCGGFGATNLLDPTAAQDAATRHYVDARISPVFDYYLSNVASADVAGYKKLAVVNDAAQNTVAVLGDADEVALEEWVSPAGSPGTTAIQAGDIIVRVYAKVSSADSTDMRYQLRARAYVRDLAGVETLIDSYVDSIFLGVSTLLYSLPIHLTESLEIAATDRIVLKLSAIRSGSPPRTNDATVTVYIGSGTTMSRLSLPLTMAVLDNYLLLAGGTMSGDLAVCSGACPAWTGTPVLGVEGAAEITGTLEVDGAATLDGGAVIEGTATVCSGACPSWTGTPALGVEGDAEITGSLEVDGLAQLDGGAKLGGTLDTQGNTVHNGIATATDVAPRTGVVIGGQHAGAACTGANCTGGSVTLAGGCGFSKYTAVNIGLGPVTLTTRACPGATGCTVGIALCGSDGTPDACGIGVPPDFLYGASTTEAAANLCAAVEAHAVLGPRVAATASGTSCNMLCEIGTTGISVSTSVSARFSATQGAAGPVGLGPLSHTGVPTLVIDNGSLTLGCVRGACPGGAARTATNDGYGWKFGGTTYVEYGILTTTASTVIRQANGGIIGWSSGNDGASGSYDLNLTRAAAGALRVAGLKGAGTTTNIQPAASVTFAANPGDASKTATALIPAKRFAFGITSRVTTAGTNCGGMHIGTAADPDLWCADCPVTLNATSDLDEATDAPMGWDAAARDVVVTGTDGVGNPVNCFGLVVALTPHWIDINAATAN